MVAILVSTEAPEGEQFNNLDLEKIETMNVLISIDWAQNSDIIEFRISGNLFHGLQEWILNRRHC